jgi:leucine-rich repeat protein SHOC2
MGGLLSQLVAEAALSPDASFKVYGAKLKGKDEREYMRLLLEKLPLMKWISVEKSGIKSVPEAVNLFKELRGLVLPHNLIKSLPIVSLSSLVHLNVSHNALSVFPEAILKLERLEYLDVSHNAVSVFPASSASSSGGGSFSALKNLRTLILSFNPLNTFPLPILELKKLKELEMSQCGLSWLPQQEGSIINSHQASSAPPPPSSSSSATSSSSIDWPLLFRKNLIKFDVSNNALGSLSGVDALVHLEFLRAASTQLDTFPDLAPLVKLSHLDLSHNRIVQLPPFLAKLERLQTLKLNDNRILEIPKHIKSLSVLRELFVLDSVLRSTLSSVTLVFYFVSVQLFA